MKLIDSLLKIDKEKRTSFEVVLWWELKRVFFNLIVLIFGLVSLKIMSLTVVLERGEDLIEPFAILGFGLLANFCYTFGWLTELSFVNNSRTYGPKMFKFGLYLTVIGVLLPGLIHSIIWLINYK